MGFMNSLGFVGLARPFTFFPIFNILCIFFNGTIKGSHKICQAQKTSLPGHFCCTRGFVSRHWGKQTWPKFIPSAACSDSIFSWGDYGLLYLTISQKVAEQKLAIVLSKVTSNFNSGVLSWGGVPSTLVFVF